MTEQPTGVGPDNPVGVLQALSFEQISDDGLAARYAAQVESDQAPGSPVFAVTVTLASSLQGEAGKQLETLFTGMKASFVPTLGGSPNNGGPVGELFNIGTQMLIEISLASYGGTGPVGVAVTLGTTTGIVPVPIAIQQTFPHLVGAGLEDYWRANPYQSFTATVTPRSGKGTVRYPKQSVVRGGTYYPYGKEVIVAADIKQALDYNMSGNFVLVRHNVKGA